MALHDVPYAGYTNVFLLDGVSDRLRDRMPEALAELIDQRRPLRSAKRAGHAGQRASDRIERSIRRVDEEPSSAALVELAGRTPLAALPVTITFAGSRVAIATAHGAFDGVSSLDLIHDLLDLAAGRPLPVRPPASRRPLLRALRTVRPDAVREFLRRRIANPGTGAEAASPESVGAPRTRMVSLRLDPTAIRAVRAGSEPSGRRGRSTLNSRLCSLVVEALRVSYRGTDDLRIRVPVDLRHHVRGRAVDGNFICGDPLGTLLGDGWEPSEITRRLAELAGPSGVVSLATGWPRHVVARMRPQHPRLAVNISLVTTDRTPPDGFDPDAGILACTSIGRWPSPVFVFVWTISGSTHVSVWDETGAFDLDRFEPALRAGIARRVQAPVALPVDDGARPREAHAEAQQQ